MAIKERDAEVLLGHDRLAVRTKQRGQAAGVTGFCKQIMHAGLFVPQNIYAADHYAKLGGIFYPDHFKTIVLLHFRLSFRIVRKGAGAAIYGF